MPSNVSLTISTGVFALSINFAHFSTASELNANADNQELSFSQCDIDLSSLDYRQSHLCSDQTGGITFEFTGLNRANSGLMGDTTPIFNNFWRNEGETPDYTISLTPFSEAPEMWQVQYLREDGSEINTTFSYFIWSRNFSAPGVGKNEFAIPFGPTRSLKCLKDAEGEHPLNQCIAYYTAAVCATWHDRYNQPVRLVRYPTISARSDGYESSLLMMRQFEVVQRTAEELLDKTLTISCDT